MWSTDTSKEDRKRFEPCLPILYAIAILVELSGLIADC